MLKFSEVNLHNVDKLFREASKWFYFDKFKMLLHHNKVIITEIWFKYLKGHVNDISCDPSFEELHARFPT